MTRNSALTYDQQLVLLEQTVNQIYVVFEDSETGLVNEMIALLRHRTDHDTPAKVVESIQHMRHLFAHLCSIERNPVTEYIGERFDMVTAVFMTENDQSASETMLL